MNDSSREHRGWWFSCLANRAVEKRWPPLFHSISQSVDWISKKLENRRKGSGFSYCWIETGIFHYFPLWPASFLTPPFCSVFFGHAAVGVKTRPEEGSLRAVSRTIYGSEKFTASISAIFKPGRVRIRLEFAQSLLVNRSCPFSRRNGRHLSRLRFPRRS